MPGANDLLGNLISFYALPSAIALTIKVILLYLCRQRLAGLDRWLLVLLAAFFAMNLSELMLFTYVNRPNDGLLALQAYYLSALCACLAILGLSLHIKGVHSKAIHSAISALAILSVFLVFTPDVALSGVKTIGYSVTRIAAAYYWVVAAIISISLAAAIGVFCSTALVPECSTQKRRALALLVALLPLVVLIQLTLIAMLYGLKINATVTTPLTITFFMAVLIYVDSEQGLFNFLSHVPRTEEWHILRALRRICYGNVGLREAKDILEEIKILHAMQQSLGDTHDAAKLLRVSVSTVQRKLNKIEKR